jgi:hypothetical protein
MTKDYAFHFVQIIFKHTSAVSSFSLGLMCLTFGRLIWSSSSTDSRARNWNEHVIFSSNVFKISHRSSRRRSSCFMRSSKKNMDSSSGRWISIKSRSTKVSFYFLRIKESKMLFSVKDDEKLEVFTIYVKRTAELHGITACRSVYEDAINKLNADGSREMCIRYAELER